MSAPNLELHALMSQAEEARIAGESTPVYSAKAVHYDHAADLYDQAALVATNPMDRGYIRAAATHHRATASADRMAASYKQRAANDRDYAETVNKRDKIDIALLALLWLMALAAITIVTVVLVKLP